MNTTKPIRFATLIRVSTEAQEKKGESLRTQTKQLTGYVESLGGKIIKSFGGQEHGVEGYERLELNMLLADAQEQKFDAVIVTDADRWSRDNEKSKSALRILRDNEIRFFCGSMEYDLNNPPQVLFLGMSAEIGEFQAKMAAKKSHENRLERAKKGIPTAGKLPFGRTFDKDTNQWGIIPEKEAMVKDVAKRYLAGESMLTISAEYNIHHTILARALKEKCGDTWTQNFYKTKRQNGKKIKTLIDSKEFTIPRLLPDKTIKAIHEKIKSNRTLTHGDYKNSYLLGRMVFCGSCGYVLNSFTITGHSYFRHPRNMAHCNCNRPKGCNQIAQGKLEAQVLAHLYDLFENKAMIAAAIEKAIPNNAEVIADQKQLERIKQELKKLQASRDRFVKAIGSGILSEAEMHKQNEQHNQTKEKLENSKERLEIKLAAVPDTQTIKNLSQLRRTITKKPLTDMTYNEKKALLQMVFGGKTLDGKRQGIYINWQDPKSYTFDIHGQLFVEKDMIVFDDTRFKAVFGENSNIPSQLVKLHSIKHFNFSISEIGGQAA